MDEPRASAPPARRVEVCIEGMVQGVGFRPFVHRLATSLELRGTVRNTGWGVRIELEGAPGAIQEMLRRIPLESPAGAQIVRLETAPAAPTGTQGFVVLESAADGGSHTRLSPDIAMCAECRLELGDPDNRRFRYPFISCVQCGPRFSIVEALPYDRVATTMRGFPLCIHCQAEYDDPSDRRFHAQTIACAQCGPQLALWDQAGQIRASREDALVAAAEAVRRGEIVALKGLGGFQLIVDARNSQALSRLRQRKARPEKPFAVMFPGVDQLEAACEVSALELRLLQSREAPIVLVKRRRRGAPELERSVMAGSDSRLGGGDGPWPGALEECETSDSHIAWEVAPGNPWLGAMLPYTPLHQVLMDALSFPVVATSGNRTDEPLCLDELEALERLAGIADCFLVHDRPIARQLDDSVVRVVNDEALVLRHARGYAPTYVSAGVSAGVSAAVDDRPTVLAVGGHQKSAVALLSGGELVLGPHVGDLGSLEAELAFRRSIDQLIDIRGPGTGGSSREGAFAASGRWAPDVVACDLHPGYRSSAIAEQLGGRLERVQHHHAHLLACLADNGMDPREAGSVIGVTWDGAGMGMDGSLWGGEFLLLTDTSSVRVAHMRTFRLPGGERAAREPRRSALGVLSELMDPVRFQDERLAPVRAFSPREREVLGQALRRGINAPVTSSVGRLFDAVASLLDLRQVCSFEGQAAIALEAAVDPGEQGCYEFAVSASSQENAASPPMEVKASAPLIIDWRPLIEGILGDLERGMRVDKIAARFHHTLARIIGEVCLKLRERFQGRPPPRQVALSGGCFQNRVLTELAVRELEACGFQPLRHRRIPPNDGGLAVGQALAVVQALTGE